MMRRTPLARSTKPIRTGGLPAATRREQEIFQKLVTEIGCVVCLFYCRHEDGSRVENSVGEIHHLLSGGNRVSHSCVIPLCRMHHTDGQPGNPSRHSILGQFGKAEFEETYAPELDLLAQCEEWLNLFYWSGEIITDERIAIDNVEQAAQGDDRCTDTDANDQSDDGYARQEVEQLQTFDKPVHISVTHYRARLCDPDNLNAKGVIDAIVKAGLLQDDSASFVKSIRHEQVKVKSYSEEKTRITIEEVAA